MTFISPTTQLAATTLNSLSKHTGNQQFSLPSAFNICCKLAPQGAPSLPGLFGGLGHSCHPGHGQAPVQPGNPHRGGCILEPHCPPEPQCPPEPECPSEPECPPEPGCPAVEQEWTVSQGENGTATIDLGDTYELELNENKSQIIVRNKENGEETNIWGDPHIDWNKDGKTDANFWEKTTFQLEDGTKITIDTEKFKNNEMYVANDITITKGDNVIQVTGLSQNEKGDMQIHQSDTGGYLMDMLVTDGFVVEENACGEGWINSETGEQATQEDFDVTKPGEEKPYEFCQEFGRSLGVFLMTGNMNWNWDS